MKHMKKLLAATLTAVLLAGCSAGGTSTAGDNPAARTEPLAASGVTSTPSLSDVPAGAWFTDAVNWCLEQGLIDPASASTFAPGDDSNRATLAAALYRAAGSPTAGTHSFNDIPSGSWYADAAAWASANGVISGYPGGRFGGEDPITREQTVTILWRYAGSPAPGASQDFTDEASISAYAAQAVDWSRANGVISGNPDGSFNPQGPVTRGQIAVILRQYLNNSSPTTPDDGEAQVFMTTDISSDGLMKIYEALGYPVTGEKTAIKLSMGEPGGHNFLQPALIQELVTTVNGTIVDSNTAYGGRRASTALHYQVAEDHGFAAIAPVQILDEDGEMRIPVEGGQRLTENIVGGHFADYDFYVVLSHFKGHAMGGFGGAIKNISIGISSPAGKMLQHSGGHSSTSWGGGTQDQFLEAMAEAAKSVDDYMGDNIIYISVMNNLSVDCDCDSNPAEPDMHDIGILASTDPVALDQACVDLVYSAQDGASLIERIESRNGIHTLEHAEAIGLGSRTYQIINID